MGGLRRHFGSSKLGSRRLAAHGSWQVCELMASWQVCELMAIWQQCELMAAGHGSSDLSSCEKGEQWQLALALLNEMWEANSLEPDVIRVIRQGMPRLWPREAQAWPRARCGRRSWSPTSSAKALAARGAGLAASSSSSLGNAARALSHLKPGGGQVCQAAHAPYASIPTSKVP